MALPLVQTREADAADITRQITQMVAASGISREKVPALLGGVPVRTAPYPSWPTLDEAAVKADIEAVSAVLRSRQWGGAPYPGVHTRAFAAAFLAMQVGNNQPDKETFFAVPMMNGTLTMEVALRAADIGWGDEVIVPAYTFQATATAPIAIGAVPVLVDVDPDTYCISPIAIEAAITDRTKAIMPVHLGAQMADMDEIMAIASRHNLVVIEDCAHAHGAEWNGRGAGTIGHFGSFSLQSSKLLTTGEGGVLIGRGEDTWRKVVGLVDCGRSPTSSQGSTPHSPISLTQDPTGLMSSLIGQLRTQVNSHSLEGAVGIGSNYRMTELQAALGRTALQRFPQQQLQRAAMADYLEQQFEGVEGVRLLKRQKNHTRRSVYRYIFAIDPELFGVDHQVVALALHLEGIACWQGYAALHCHESFQPLRSRLPVPSVYPQAFNFEAMSFPEAESASEAEAIWLEESVFRAGKQGIDDVVRALKKIQASAPLLKAARVYFLEAVATQGVSR